MQIRPRDSEQLARQFGAAVASKVMGAAVSGTLLALVSTFGTAGTGTAISTLSGAAATHATLAWVGGLAGGGMAAGAVLTGGLTLIVGLAAYKMLGSESRPFDSLSEQEQRIVQACWLLIAAIEELQEGRPEYFNRAIAAELLSNSLFPLQDALHAHPEDICAGLDARHAVAFRQHVLTDFDRVVIKGFHHLLEADAVDWNGGAARRHEEYVIGGVFYGLLTRTVIDKDEESQLVLVALRRSRLDLADASEAQLSDYLDQYGPEQLKGIASNVKGIYHEVLWVHRYNAEHASSSAEHYADTNHPGADVRIRDDGTGDVLHEYQLKATDSAAYVRHHFERYPGVDTLVSDELAQRMAHVQSSGISNAEITGKVKSDIDALADNTIMDRVEHSAEYATLAAGGHGLINMLRGSQAFPEAVTESVRKVGMATAATAITAYLFG